MSKSYDLPLGGVFTLKRDSVFISNIRMVITSRSNSGSFPLKLILKHSKLVHNLSLSLSNPVQPLQ